VAADATSYFLLFSLILVAFGIVLGELIFVFAQAALTLSCLWWVTPPSVLDFFGRLRPRMYRSLWRLKLVV